MVNSLDYTLVLQDYPEGYILSDFYKLPRDLSPSRMFVKFCFKLLYSNRCGKNFQIYGVHIPRKCIDLRRFYSCPSPLRTRPQVLAITPQAEGNYSLPKAAFFRKSVSSNSRKGWRELSFALSKSSQKI